MKKSEENKTEGNECNDEINNDFVLPVILSIWEDENVTVQVFDTKLK